ncbi:SAV_2336 N-terminal domain-related protein [Streptomyces sp. RFCAC02]|uniref:SAV_2336 N-terminal domain-related protein n=1 Tax=Streptomyces sp. RFCAC02 TaxID=2499143 RepID=UPI00143CD014|nr:SAV_2336 N-terminal domain-related protein [Streptomyces sp. RFCAC02]
MSEPDGPPGATPFAALIGALRGARLDPEWFEVADALWLAQYCGPLPSGARDGEGPAAGDPAGRGAPPLPGPRTAAENGHRPTLDSRRSAGPPEPAERPVPLHAARPGTGAAESAARAAAVAVGVPAARTLPGPLGLERALRPLQRYRPPGRPPRRSASPDLDERKTVERTARAGGLLMPAFRDDTRGHTELQLLMDAAPAMRIWQRMLGELAEVFTRLGAFRDLQVHYLHQSPDGAPATSSRFDPAGAVLRPARQLQDPTGRRLTVVVSDCTGPLWSSGGAHRLLHGLARYAPVAVVQPLPQRLWARTRLPASAGMLRREEGWPAAARLRFTADATGYPSPAPPGAVPIPVLPPAPAALGAWAALLCGPGPDATRAAVGWVRADQPPAPVRRSGGPPPTAAAMVARFRAGASPGAAQLAVYLAAAPLFLPVMQLVQRTMLPDSGPAELSEVLLSGLVRRPGDDRDDRWYVFADGVQDHLLADLGHDEALLVLKHCSAYVEQRFGRGGPNFPALALAQLSGGERVAVVPPPAPGAVVEGPAGHRLTQPFAEVAARVLRRFLPETQSAAPPPGASPVTGPQAAVREARRLAGRFAEDGKVQHQLDAVRLLRQAAEAQRARGGGTDPELWSELAEQLLSLWRVQRDGELLAEARAAATTAAAFPGSVRARTALARVLHAAAAERRAEGDSAGALELWQRADREFAAVCATPGLDRAAALGVTLERVQVLEEQWRLGGDTALLQESVGTVEAVADAWPPGEPQPSGLPLAHGRALLRLAGAAHDTELARVYAGQAAGSLRRGGWALESEHAPAGERVAALLDLVDALLLTAADWPAAQEPIAQAARLATDPVQRAGCLIRAGRLAVRRFEADGLPAHLEEAAARFGAAGGTVSRDRPEYSDLIEEWGVTLLRRAALPDGDPFVSRAVRVLRDCRMETPGGHARLSYRLLTLGRALMVRYRATEDLVDLREAEHLFNRSVHQAGTSVGRACAWFELGETHRRAYRHTRRPERLEQAADAYRRAASEARTAREEPASDGGSPDEAIRLAARALHQRGVVFEVARRPLAAADAYRSALELWHLLPDGAAAGEPTRTRLAGLRGER